MTTLRELLDAHEDGCYEAARTPGDFSRFWSAVEAWAFGGEGGEELGLVQRVMGHSRDDVYERLQAELWETT